MGPDDEVRPRAAMAPYRQLAAILRAQLARGDYDADNPLPSERTLTERYGLARTTVRNAVTLLVDEGLVYRAHGRGVYPVEDMQNGPHSEE